MNEVEKAYVLLMVGNERRFLDETKLFYDYIVQETNVPSSNVELFLGAYKTKAETLTAVERTFEKAEKKKGAKVVLFYNGHGHEEFFGVNGENIYYEELVDAIDPNVNFLFINFSCHAGGAIPIFKRKGLLPRIGSVVAATQTAQEYGAGNLFLTDLIDHYRQRKPYLRRKVGSQKIEGKNILNFREGEEPEQKISKNGRLLREIITDLSWSERRVKFRRPKAGGSIFKPQRYGKCLDYLLFAKEQN